jgi:hypothetical protein
MNCESYVCLFNDVVPSWGYLLSSGTRCGRRWQCHNLWHYPDTCLEWLRINTRIPQSQYVCRPNFKPSTFRIQVRRVTRIYWDMVNCHYTINQHFYGIRYSKCINRPVINTLHYIKQPKPHLYSVASSLWSLQIIAVRHINFIPPYVWS